MTTPQSKNKVLILLIGILLVANLVALGFLFKSNQQDEIRSKKHNSVADYLEKEVGFSASQMAAFDSLYKRHSEDIKTSFRSFSADRRLILKDLAASDFTDSAVKKAATDIQARQQSLEVDMLQYLKSIRNLCNEAQRGRFDTGYYKIFRKRPEAHKEK